MSVGNGLTRSEIVRYLSSPVGCDGGNIAGKNWLFAIEYGGKPDIDDYKVLKPQVGHWSIPEHEVLEFVEACKFNQRAAKFEAVKHGYPVSEYISFAETVGLYTANSEYYKGNVGGFCFPKDNEAHYKEFACLLGLKTKQELKELEIEVRAEMFQSWVREFQPNCICCFGSGDVQRFFKAFSDLPLEAADRNKLDGYNYYKKLVNNGKTMLFVMPHLTADFGNGMTNDSIISSYGAMVRDEMERNGLTIF